MSTNGLYYPPADYEACWVFGGGKGGTVKTTSCIHCALVLARTGRTLVIDADPRSQSASKWAIAYEETTGKEPPFTVIQWTNDGLAKGVDRLRREGGYKHVLLDIGGETERLFRQSLRLANSQGESELILPISPSGIELVTVNASLSAAEDVAAEQDRSIGAQLLFCRDDRRSNELITAKKAADREDWPYLDTVIPSQKRYRCFGTIPTDAGLYEQAVPEVIAA